MMKLRTRHALLALLIGTLTIPAFAAERDDEEDGFVRVLVPIAFSSNQQLPGAHGSLWTTELWVHNGLPYDIHLQPLWLCEFLPCVPPPLLAPGTFERLNSVDSNRNDGGALLYIDLPVGEHDFDPAPHPDHVRIHARLLELSRRAQPTGVEIPVIREDEFLNRNTVLLAVPVGEGIRSTLRVYDPILLRGSAVGVELLDPQGNLVASTTLHPGNDPVVPEEKPSGYYFRPGYDAIHNLTDVFPELRQFDHFHVRLTPLTPDWEYWGFVSVTDDETQHVLMITPQ